MNSMNEQSFDLSQFGSRIGTRLEGDVARPHLVAELDSLPPDGQLMISLQGIDVLSGSFADEVIGKTYQALVEGNHKDRSMCCPSTSA
jgi:hypothetical protein